MVMTGPWLEHGARQRLQRFCMSIALIAYLRKTWRSVHENHGLLQLQQEPLTTIATVRKAAKYTFAAQLIACTEYLIPLIKPVLALRIARLLVWTRADEERNVLYGPHPRNTVDLYGVPDKASLSTASKPIMLFVHGGGWCFGHKWQYGLAGKYLAKQGFLVGVINYRTYPTGSVVEQVEDVENAVRWVVDHGGDYGGDCSKIFLSGHSSGAHIGAMTLIQSSVAAATGAASASTTTSSLPLCSHQAVKGFIGLSGPYDIADHYKFESARHVGPLHGVHEISAMKPAMLGLSRFDEHSPTRVVANTNHLDLKLPPFYVLHGNADTIVPVSSSKKFVDSLKQAKHPVEFIELDGCSHEDIVFAVMGDNVDIKPEVISHIKRIMHTQATREATVISPGHQPIARI